MALAAAVAVAAGATVLGRVRRVEVTGASMEPTLRGGDRLLVMAGRPLRVGAIVAVRDPRRPDRLMVKRVAALGPDGVDVRGDAPEWSTDSRAFGPVPASLIDGTVIWRYAPPARAGRVAPGAGPSGGFT